MALIQTATPEGEHREDAGRPEHAPEHLPDAELEDLARKLLCLQKWLS